MSYLYFILIKFDQIFTLIHEILYLSISSEARTWFISLCPRSINSWQELQEQFLKKFFPLYHTFNSKKAIQNISQKDDEMHFQCWERF